MAVVPMFPRGLVHFPGVVLPLQVFEPRYRSLTIDCLDGDRAFGVVLIERGSEVGGGDVRCDVGTMTTIVHAGFDDSGLVRLDTVGTHRIRVLRWLADDPYPRADVEDLAAPIMSASATATMAAVERKVRRALAMHAELDGPSVAYDVPLDPDPSRAVLQLAAIAPVGPADHQRLLATPGAVELLALIDELIEGELLVLAARLAGY